MKRIKSAFCLFAAITGLGTALASKSQRSPCEDEQQYIKVTGTTYAPVSDDYYCVTYSGAPYCTYYLSNTVPEVYTVCTYGNYVDPVD